MKNIFFKILLITLLFNFSYSASQNIDNYINGYKEGFRVGYCQSELTCSAPIPNSRSIFIGNRPLQYPVGYAQGLEDGKEKRINDNKKKLTSTSTDSGNLMGSKDPMMTRNRVNKPEPGLYISAEEYFNRGKKKYDFNAYNGAIGDFTKAIEIGSKNDNTNIKTYYFFRAYSKAFLGEFAGAIKDIELAKQNGWSLRIQGELRRWRKNKL
jgi:hypothetical protein